VGSVFLERNHLFLVNPDGGVEDVAAMKAGGFGAIFCNVLDFDPGEWQLVRDRAAQQGVVCGPWARMIDSGFNFDPSKLDMLLGVADDWGQPAIINVEKELDWSASSLTQYIAEAVVGRDVAFSVECWPFASVDWRPLAEYPFLPQIFPQEVDAAKDPHACRDAWWAAGVRCVVFTFGTYWDIDPETFERLSPYGLYNADNCGNDFQRWAAKGTTVACQSQPEPPKEPPMPPVTSTQAREAVCFDAQAWEQNEDAYTPLARLTVARRICSEGNTDPKWNTIRDEIVKLLDDQGVPK
jgi:hypothetical protein